MFPNRPLDPYAPPTAFDETVAAEESEPGIWSFYWSIVEGIGISGGLFGAVFVLVMASDRPIALLFAVPGFALGGFLAFPAAAVATLFAFVPAGLFTGAFNAKWLAVHTGGFSGAVTALLCTTGTFGPDIKPNLAAMIFGTIGGVLGAIIRGYVHTRTCSVSATGGFSRISSR